MKTALKHRWFYFICALFIFINSAFILNEFYWFNLFPFAITLIGLSLFSSEKLLYFITFFTPLSLNLEQLSFGIGMYLPTEPLMFGVMFVFLFKLWYDWSYDWKILKHPVTVTILFNLLWIFISTFTSEMPIVSLKFLISRLWFVVCFYFMTVLLFKKLNNITRFLWFYIIPLLIVVVYTLIRHAQFNFDEKPGHWVMQPFYKDHTSYGAVLALYTPVVIGFLFDKTIRFNIKVLISFVLIGLTIGLIFSYTRAAWVSLAFALGVFVLMYYKVRFSRIVIFSILGLIAFFYVKDDVLMKLEKNRQDSSSNLTEHVQSISNVATDASNLERLNRWSCAWRMFLERPCFGWGPGTYMFQYASFQHSNQLTIISTHGADAGNAHSEYLGPLAEMGVIGFLSIISILLSIVFTAIRTYNTTDNLKLKLLVLTCFLGIVTYFVHGLLNNFLDTDKASVPIWGFSAIIVAIDLYHRKLNANQLPN